MLTIIITIIVITKYTKRKIKDSGKYSRRQAKKESRITAKKESRRQTKKETEEERESRE